MIKKSLFEDELIHGMQRELQPYEKKQGMNNLVKAAEYLHAAMEIFEEAGMTTKADRILKILAKIAVSTDSNDIKKHHKSDESYEKILNWIKSPNSPIDPSNPQPGEEISMRSLLSPGKPSLHIEPGEEVSMTSLMPRKQLPPGDDLVFRSVMDDQGADDNDAPPAPRKFKDPTAVSDSHNDNPIELSAADDNAVDVEQPESFDDDYQKWLELSGRKPKKKKLTQEDFGDLAGLVVLDDDNADSLLDSDLNNAAEELLQPNAEDKTFEDAD